MVKLDTYDQVKKDIEMILGQSTIRNTDKISMLEIIKAKFVLREIEED